MQEKDVWMMFGVLLSLAILIGAIIVIRSKMGDRRLAKAIARRELLARWMNPGMSLEALMGKLTDANERSKKPLFFDTFGMFSFADMAKMFQLDQCFQLVEIMINGVNSKTVTLMSHGCLLHEDMYIINIAGQLVSFFGGHAEAIKVINQVQWARHHDVQETLEQAIEDLHESHKELMAEEARKIAERRGYAAMGLTPPPEVQEKDML